MLLISRCTHTPTVVNTDALMSQNRFLIHFIYRSLPSVRPRKMQRGVVRMEKRDWRARKERVMERVGCKGKADESGNNGAKVRGVEREDKKTGGQNR